MSGVSSPCYTSVVAFAVEKVGGCWWVCEKGAQPLACTTLGTISHAQDFPGSKTTAHGLVWMQNVAG